MGCKQSKLGSPIVCNINGCKYHSVHNGKCRMHNDYIRDVSRIAKLCNINGCKNNIPDDYSHCKNHTCNIKYCKNRNLDGYSHCKNHTCRIDDCFDPSGSYKYCTLHKNDPLVYENDPPMYEEIVCTRDDTKIQPIELVSGSNTECIICMDSERQVTFINCGHFMVCMKCAPRLTDCPMCRKPVSGKWIRTYM
jgi:hypothetical protein